MWTKQSKPAKNLPLLLQSSQIEVSVLSLLSLLAPVLVEPATGASPLGSIEKSWHKDALVAVRDRLPKVLIVLLILFVLARIIHIFVNKMQKLALRPGANPQRSAQWRTMATIIRATSYSVLGLLAFLQILNLLNIEYGPLLASAGIVGVGIGLAAQSLFKDIINGVLILIEDQFNVGEVVKIASVTGTVEDLTLRLTRIRDGDGTLYTIPNSQIATVSNLSRDYAIASLSVSVDASVNPDKVMAILNELGSSIQSDAAFKDVILAAPSVLGVDKIDGRSILYPVNIRVRPNQKDGILRELRKRIVVAFEQQSIPLGADSSLLIMQTPKDPTAPPAQHIISSGN